MDDCPGVGLGGFLSPRGVRIVLGDALHRFAGVKNPLPLSSRGFRVKLVN